MFDKDHAVLLLVDIQPDFMPGGALAVAEGDRILAPVRELMTGDRFGHYVATQDWHPPAHVSFASSHPGRAPMEEIELYGHRQTLWPDHCIQGSAGAALHPDLPWERVSAVIRKGMDPAVDSYSGCGLARDVCVKFSAEDAAHAGFRTFVLWDLTRAVDPTADEAVRSALVEQGVSMIDSAQFAQ